MSQMERISVNAFENVMKETYEPTEKFNWNGIEVTVKKNLSLNEMLEFVNIVVSTCFSNESNSYMPEVRDFATRICILDKYANFTMPKNIETQYELVYCTDAVEQVLQHVNSNQFNEIELSISKKIDNMSQANIEAVNKQMNELFNEFNNLQNSLASLFDGIENIDIRAFAGAISNGGIDEEKLVKAYTSIHNDKSGDK